jgi:hypothetical protein
MTRRLVRGLTAYAIPAVNPLVGRGARGLRLLGGPSCWDTAYPCGCAASALEARAHDLARAPHVDLLPDNA